MSLTQGPVAVEKTVATQMLEDPLHGRLIPRLGVVDDPRAVETSV